MLCIRLFILFWQFYLSDRFVVLKCLTKLVIPIITSTKLIFSLLIVIGLFIEKTPIIFIYLSIFCCMATTFIYVYVRHLFKKWK